MLSGSGVAALAGAGALVLVQLLVPQARHRVSPGSSWFQSFTGGLAVAYVFARLLPELANTATRTDTPDGVFGLLERHAFLVALAGLLAYYAVLDWAADEDRRERQERGAVRTPWSFWASVALYVVFNLFVGYLLVHQVRPGLTELGLYTVALSARYAIGEISLRDQDRRAYDRVVRWVLAATILVGWGIGVGTELGDAPVNTFSALLTGSIILTSLKQQLPSSEQASFPVFAGSCVAFSALLLAL